MMQQKQPQGLLGRLTNRSESSGLNMLESFAAGLDPLIMPSMRGGDAIRERGDKRAKKMTADAERNKSVQYLLQNGHADLAQAVQSGVISGRDAMGYLMKGGTAGVVVDGQIVNPKTGEVIFGGSAGNGLGDYGDAQAFRKEFTGLPTIKNLSGVTEAYGRILASADNPSAAGDLALIFNYMKVLDPNSTVREGEFATAAKAGSLGEVIQSQVNQIESGKLLTPSMRADFVDRAGRLYDQQSRISDSLYTQYGETAKVRGFDPDRVLPDFRFQGERTPDINIVTPDINTVPQMPNEEGLTIDEWTNEIWPNMTDEEKRFYLDTGGFK